MIVCTACGATPTKRARKCPACGVWGSLIGDARSARAKAGGPVRSTAPVPARPARVVSGVDQVDRVLGGGAVAGSVVMISGRRGSGKSTLVGQWCSGAADAGPVLIASGEEAEERIRQRLHRTESTHPELFVSESDSWEEIQTQAERLGAVAVVVDSVQTLAIGDRRAGSPSALADVSKHVPQWARQSGAVVWLIAQETVAGEPAGGTRLPHAVDVELTFDGAHLESVKNRHGQLERARLRMTAYGLV